MDPIVRFHLKEKDDKLFLVIQKPELHPITQTQSPTSFVEATHHDDRLPRKIKHPYHPQHPLHLSVGFGSHRCLCCGDRAKYLIYDCFICNAVMHVVCAMQPISIVIDKPKRHDHPLSFFNRKNSLVCNVCGWLSKISPTYICVRCDFVTHKDCMSFPTIIKISRHHHRISYTSSLQDKECSCGVCRQSVDGDYGAYTCGKCCDYVVHSRCALNEDVWDGKELSDIPDEDNIIDASPFEIKSEGVILHFLHEHDLLLKVSMLYDEDKFCQACVLPIYDGNFYSCKNCDFILHESCAHAPRLIQHALHPHPLAIDKDIHTTCYACIRLYDGFGYRCIVKGCNFELDVRCASISEPFEFENHEHALFMALNQDRRLTCQVCKEVCYKQLNCMIKCGFVVCFVCASLPYKVRYKHEEHSLILLWGKEACEKYWCEVCECNLIATKPFYSCNECCTFLHTWCLLGKFPYIKPRQ